MNASKITYDTPLVVCWYDYGFSYDDDNFDADSSMHQTTISELYSQVKNDRDFEPNYEPIYKVGVDSNVDDISDEDYDIACKLGLLEYEAGKRGDIVNDVISYINDSEKGYVQSLDCYNAACAEKERNNMEKLATKYAKMWNTPAGSYNFVQLLRSYKEDIEKQQDKFNEYENRNERWAAHMYYGNTHEYFNDEQFSNDRFHNNLNEIESIENWLYQHCPLLMACFEEKELSNSNTH